ncbi:hypothetical protein TRIUR3_17032 [Triticum urartu]|uniref:FACT complex subunit n=2 Tax=Triticum urartu TaxID=4572 RepID=M7ZB12_TRIUA|nr:hypothetical protein TRIUR3_17032 [Triticum urartu]
MEKVIDEERKVSHLSLMYDTEKVIIDPLKAKENGGKFDLRPGASSNDDYLYYDPASIIICATGSRKFRSRSGLRLSQIAWKHYHPWRHFDQTTRRWMSKEELQRQHQAELARQKNAETSRRLDGGGSEGDQPLILMRLKKSGVRGTGRTESTMEFQNYINKVNDHWSQPQFKGLDLEFHIPLRELGFHGVPYKASAFIIPTSTCLVELIETPFLVVTLGEIEIVNLERVGFGTKKFDMAIVFNDFKKDVLRIDSIQSTSLDAIKEWIDTTDLKYYESRLYLNWRPILKTIIDDPQKFVDDGGWEFLNMEASDSGAEETKESDQGYEPSAAEPESELEDEDSDSVLGGIRRG